MELVYVALTPFPVTSTLMVHKPATAPTCAGMIAPVSEITCVPVLAVTLPNGQVVEALGVGAITTPFVVLPGSVSVKATLSSWLVFELVREIVRVDIPFAATVGGKKTLLTERPLTVRLALILLGRLRFSLSEIFAGAMMLV